MIQENLKCQNGSLESDHRERKAMKMETQIPEGGTKGGDGRRVSTSFGARVALGNVGS